MFAGASRHEVSERDFLRVSKCRAASTKTVAVKRRHAATRLFSPRPLELVQCGVEPARRTSQLDGEFADLDRARAEVNESACNLMAGGFGAVARAVWLEVQLADAMRMAIVRC